MNQKVEKMQLPIRASDKVSDVLARDARLVEVFVRQSPHFAKLRTPGMRRVMARLVTVEQAARICGAETSALVHELNRALGIDGASNDSLNDAGDTTDHTNHPDHTARQPGARAESDDASLTIGARAPVRPGVRIVDLDVREDLRQGREPFSRIMGAVGALGDGEALCLRATFEPVPLFAVMGKRGFDHMSEQLKTDDWRVWFYRSTGAAGAEGRSTGPAASSAQANGPSATAAPAAAATADPSATHSAADVGGTTEREVVLDVRGLEPPEPMQRTLEALETLADGAVLVQVNVRVPHFLLPILEERGFDYELFQPNPERVVVRIWRASPAAAAASPRTDDERRPS